MQNEALSSEENKPQQGSSSPQDYVFALDIGTRDIIGVVGVPDNEKLHVNAIEMAEHTRRAMIDGQIEDIDQVARVAKAVKEKLEQRLGYSLKRVCVAAAGRALKTQSASFSMDLEKPQAITEEIICRLEAGAVQNAEQQFDPHIEEKEHLTFYLVGYSVVEYQLDNYPMSNLLDHKGQHLSVNVIATFLPREVVSSLYTAMHKADLEIASLTLEPIAAINAAIPQNLRLLNLALVDIGAGTSDIAISKDGSIAAYTMATIAGDEITEAIMKKYLVDFSMAESIKISLCEEEEISFRDILGFKHTITPDEVQETIQPIAHALCAEIGERIIQANGGSAPSAVFLVGGGSKLPGLCAEVADYLGMDANRVAVGGNNFTMSVIAPNMDITGPEYATPLGIALSTALNLINDSFSILLNGQTAKLFRSGKLTALDVLLMNGYSYNQLISRSGQSISAEINDERKTFRGTHAVPASLLLNGEEAELSILVKAGDRLDFTPSIPGEDAHPKLEDILHFECPGHVTFLDSSFSLGTHVTVNGEPAQPEQEVNPRDKIHTFRVSLLGDLLSLIGVEGSEHKMLVNGHAAGLDYPLADGDMITYADNRVFTETAVAKQPIAPTEPLLSSKPQESKQELDNAKGFTTEDFLPSISAAPVIEKEELVPPAEPISHFSANILHFTLNGAPLSLEKKPDDTPYMLLDMLNFVDIDLSKPQGRIILKVNGQDSPYRCELAENDTIEIHWDKQTF